MKEHTEARRNIRLSGYKVLLKNVTKTGKLVPTFQQHPFEVIKRTDVMVTAQIGQEIKARNVSHISARSSQRLCLGELDHVPHLVEDAPTR